MLYDFHLHTFLSDGDLLPMELIRRAQVRGYTAFAITDHGSPAVLQSMLEALARDCELAMEQWGLQALPGVELTHLPPASIDELAARAKSLGARVVVVHGETIAEPVAPGTNLAAVKSAHVDIVGHPGLIDEETARLAAQNGIFLELSARRGHCLTNGRVAALARSAGAQLLVDSDGHSPDDLLTEEVALRVALGAGLSEEEAEIVLKENPKRLLEKVGARI